MMLLIMTSCNDEEHVQRVDSLNDKAYHFHYISLDSTLHYSNLAFDESGNYKTGRVEALNNLAFVDIMRMEYGKAEVRLNKIISTTDNQIELMVANVQMMRLCQRESRNKAFYDYYWRATRNLERISEERNSLTDRQERRVVYAETEMKIVLSTYLYYVGQLDSYVSVLSSIDESAEIKTDTAQLLNYFYNIGAGGFFQGGTMYEIKQREFDYLLRCYHLAEYGQYSFWQANALQAMSEQLQNKEMRPLLKAARLSTFKALNIDEVPDSLLAENFAERALDIFLEYKDVYQVAGAWRTLSDCYFMTGNYLQAIECLNEALNADTLINQAPALTSSIYEKLSINYSAIDDKQSSDFNRNLYLDTQENTRQDRELEARAERLDKVSMQLSILILVVVLAIILLTVLLFVLTHKRKKSERENTTESFLAPLNEWKVQEMQTTENIAEQHEEIIENQQKAELLLERNLHKNIEQRAKMAIINSITPFIDRILSEINCLQTRVETKETVDSRYDYMLELTNKIDEYNGVLTQWIQLRKGELSVKVESFRLQELFNIVAKGKSSFNLKKVNLIVNETEAVVKADKTLTLFMINTIADNARKATNEGGDVVISADETVDFVEISIADTGKGMTEKQMNEVFNHQPTASVQHGFGLMNCKGIIEKYKKISQLFSVCQISVESTEGKGSVFKFRLPRGIMRVVIAMLCLCTHLSSNANKATYQDTAKIYADSAYFCNLQGEYERTIFFSECACRYLNKYYKVIMPEGRDTMTIIADSKANTAELKWHADSLPINYNTILDLRNETAVAALALHKWDIYNYNNTIYTRLFKERSADHSLVEYVRQMQKVSDTKNASIILLVILFFSIIPLYYVFYYRHKLYYRMLVDKVNLINATLLGNTDEKIKLEQINEIWGKDASKIYATTPAATALNDIVEQIIKALENSIQVKMHDAEEMELAEDELHRLNYENSRLHINNNVLDNCFSTLKHETMYYPSRIRQIIESSTRNLDALNEITQYYKELYTILSMQAQNQLEGNLRIEHRLTSYLESIPQKLFPDTSPSIRMKKIDATYTLYIYEYKGVSLSEEQIVNLFTPLTSNLQCLLIRQIAREIGETTNHRGCGVYARKNKNNSIEVVLTLPSKVKLNKI